MKERLENLLKEIDEYYYNNNLEDSRRFRYSKLKEFAIEMCKWQLEEVNNYGVIFIDTELVENVANNL